MDQSTLILAGFFVLMIVGFYFLMVRPQRKRQQEQARLAANLQIGDCVITWSGIYGEIISTDESTIVIKVESGAHIRMARMAIAQKQLETSK